MNKQVMQENNGHYKTWQIKTYLETDNTQSKYVPVTQGKMILFNFDKYNDNITKKYERNGVSTATTSGFLKNTIRNLKVMKKFLLLLIN